MDHYEIVVIHHYGQWLNDDQGEPYGQIAQPRAKIFVDVAGNWYQGNLKIK